MTRKDFTSGEYLQPQNIGMPYNSPYDDYMLVIDEMIGIGWWATDRNQIPGKVTIYLFKKKDIRENYDRTSPDIYSLAAIKSIKESWVDNNYADLRHLIDNIETETDKPKADFSFHIKNGVEYTRFDNFRSKEAEKLDAQAHDTLQPFRNATTGAEGTSQKICKSILCSASKNCS